MRKFFTTLHRWLGFPLGLLFVITFGTGCLTTVAELLGRVEHARTNTEYVYRSTTIEEDARAVSIIIKDKKGEDKKGIRQVTLPSKDTPYYQVVARGERWTYPIDRLDQTNYSKNNKEGFFRTVLQLHRNFLLGKEGLLGVDGKYYAAWVGLIALLLSLLGLWLWLPLRRSFAIKDLVPRGKKKKTFLLQPYDKRCGDTGIHSVAGIDGRFHYLSRLYRAIIGCRERCSPRNAGYSIK